MEICITRPTPQHLPLYPQLNSGWTGLILCEPGEYTADPAANTWARYAVTITSRSFEVRLKSVSVREDKRDRRSLPSCQGLLVLSMASGMPLFSSSSSVGGIQGSKYKERSTCLVTVTNLIRRRWASLSLSVPDKLISIVQYPINNIKYFSSIFCAFNIRELATIPLPSHLDAGLLGRAITLSPLTNYHLPLRPFPYYCS